ncbi:MAG: Mitochondrial ATPase complex subunit atp10 [Trizodia sp. TS-e1964]|nr:MAG: Mitochondrial ATPase complex subunit atp10 [Trizodia sp. TS-e1964]
MLHAQRRILSRPPSLPLPLCNCRTFFSKPKTIGFDDDDAPTHPTSGLPRAPRSGEENFTPQPLRRPIGLPYPPTPGQHTGIDARSWRQRRADLFDAEKHRARRRKLNAEAVRPYFREWSNLRFDSGKSFVAPRALFRAQRALYFPNLVGQTLASGRGTQCDTTPVLLGRVSVVRVFSGKWAEDQTASFVSKALESVVRASRGRAQNVFVNVEEHAVKAWLVQLFMPRLRGLVPVEEHGRYFLVRRGMEGEVDGGIARLNGKVGYVYLVDGEGRIRWAGSGVAREEEKSGLVRGVERLLGEMEGRRRTSEVPVVQSEKARAVAAVAMAA